MRPRGSRLPLLAVAPVLIGFAVTAPAYFSAPTREEKTLVITQPVPTWCISVGLFIASIALAAALGGGWWYLAGVLPRPGDAPGRAPIR